jgi:hypothetical protein
VFRLLRLLFVLGGLGFVTWFCMTVRLGDQTLFEHVQAIWKTHESQDLLRGTKEKMGNLVNRAKGKVVKGVAQNAPGQVNSRGESPAEDPATPPMEEVPAKDRKALRGLIGHGLGNER